MKYTKHERDKYEYDIQETKEWRGKKEKRRTKMKERDKKREKRARNEEHTEAWLNYECMKKTIVCFNARFSRLLNQCHWFSDNR